MPYVAPFQTSRWVETDRQFILVQLQSAGLTAWGECTATQHCAYSYETTQTNWHLLEDFIVPILLTADIPDISDIDDIRLTAPLPPPVIPWPKLA
jgi:O-succinylbenzoate synthase